MPQRRQFLWPVGLALMIVSGFVLAGRAVSATPAPAPTFLRFTLAGADVRDGLSFVRRDAKSGYYLSARTDGFSRSYPYTTLTLSPNRTLDTMMDFTPVRAATLPRLYSGKGINIGDVPSVVERKLGALPTTTGYDRRTRQLVYTYETLFKLTRGTMIRKRMNYLATYVFQSGRLWSVEYKVKEPEPGLGEH